MNVFSFGNGVSPFGNNFGAGMFAGMWAIFGLFMLAALVLKGFALWRAARNDHKGWFIFMLVVNLLGIPEIIYLLTVGKTDVLTPSAPIVDKK